MESGRFEAAIIPDSAKLHPGYAGFATKTVVELKPNNWRQYLRGCKQLYGKDGYVNELNQVFGPGWVGYVTFY